VLPKGEDILFDEALADQVGPPACAQIQRAKQGMADVGARRGDADLPANPVPPGPHQGQALDPRLAGVPDDRLRDPPLFAGFVGSTRRGRPQRRANRTVLGLRATPR